MNTASVLIKRNVKLFFKDKSLFFMFVLLKSLFAMSAPLAADLF